MATSPTFTPDLLPEEELPPEVAERGLYKPAGIACQRCAFTTKKKGFSGRQALRAHSKKHCRDARAWQRPLVRQGLVAGFIICAGGARADWPGGPEGSRPPTVAVRRAIGDATRGGHELGHRGSVGRAVVVVLVHAGGPRRVRWSAACPSPVGAEGSREPAGRLGCRGCLGSHQS